MYICIDLLVLSYYFYPMVKMKEGFKGERFVSLPDNLLETYSKDPLIGDLFLRKIGYFPRVKYHYIQKEHGCDYTMLIHLLLLNTGSDEFKKFDSDLCLHISVRVQC